MKRIALLFCIMIYVSLWAQPSGETLQHIIQAGETLQTLAERYGTTAEQIRTLNPKLGDRLYAGMTILLPQPTTQPEARNEAAVVEQPAQPIVRPQEQVKAQTEQQVQDEQRPRLQVKVQAMFPTKNAKRAKVASLALHYESEEQANANTIRNSQGVAINGHRSQMVLMSAEGLHIIDSTLHLHTVLLPREQTAYVYSDITRRGLRFDLDYYVNLYMSSLAPDDAQGRLGYEVAATGETRHEAGLDCAGYSGRVYVATQVSQVELWISTQYEASPYLRYFMDGIDAEGIPTHLVVKRTSTYASRQGSHDTRLVDLVERDITLAELMPAPEIQMVTYSEPRQVDTFFESHMKALQRSEKPTTLNSL